MLKNVVSRLKFMHKNVLSRQKFVHNNVNNGKKSLQTSKQAPENEVPRINLVWNSIPSQLGK